MTGPQRVANLFMAFDAMLGGMSARRIGRVNLRQRYFQRRLQAALSAAGEKSLDVTEEARWLDAKDGGRGLRNAIAHGDTGSIVTDVDAAALRLQNVVRMLLWQYLRFAAFWASASETIAERFGIPPQCPLPAAYNKVLEARARGTDDALDLLQPVG